MNAKFQSQAGMFLASGYVLIMCVLVFTHTIRSAFSVNKSWTFLSLGWHVLRDFRLDILRQPVLRHFLQQPIPRTDFLKTWVVWLLSHASQATLDLKCQWDVPQNTKIEMFPTHASQTSRGSEQVQCQNFEIWQLSDFKILARESRFSANFMYLFKLV